MLQPAVWNSPASVAFGRRHLRLNPIYLRTELGRTGRSQQIVNGGFRGRRGRKTEGEFYEEVSLGSSQHHCVGDGGSGKRGRLGGTPLHEGASDGSRGGL